MEQVGEAAEGGRPWTRASAFQTTGWGRRRAMSRTLGGERKELREGREDESGWALRHPGCQQREGSLRNHPSKSTGGLGAVGGPCSSKALPASLPGLVSCEGILNSAGILLSTIKPPGLGFSSCYWEAQACWNVLTWRPQPQRPWKNIPEVLNISDDLFIKYFYLKK